MCSEFLRCNLSAEAGLPRLHHLTMPVGRTMKSVDIAGLSVNGEQILAQVTYLPFAQAGHKERALLDLAGPCRRLLLFCRCDEIRLDDRILVYTLRFSEA